MKNSKKSSTSNQEHQEAKSPAEFFAENQAIAGFDNMGKSLYTTIRELVENALDACESVNVLPEISITIEDMDMSEFNNVRGMASLLLERIQLIQACLRKRGRRERLLEKHLRAKMRKVWLKLKMEAMLKRPKRL